MIGEQEDVFYYLTVENENYPHPPMPDRGRGGHPARTAPGPASGQSRGPNCSAPAQSSARCWLRQICLRDDFGVDADVWSVTSFTELRARGRRRRIAGTCCIPAQERRLLGGAVPFRRSRPGRRGRPTTSRPCPTASARGCPDTYRALGTDGFGRSDWRQGPAPLLRDRPLPGRGRHAVVPWPRRRDRARARRRGDRALRDRSRRTRPGDDLMASGEITGTRSG